MLFAEQSNQAVLQACAERLSAIAERGDAGGVKGIASYAATIVRSMVRNPDYWDEGCEFNIKHIGSQLISVASVVKLEEEDVYQVFSRAFRFLCELDLKIGAEKELNIDLMQIKGVASYELNNFPEGLRSQIVYALYVMPVNIFKDYMGAEEVKGYKNLRVDIGRAEKAVENMNSELGSGIAKVEALKNTLGRYESAFNFVGLYDGFSSLLKSKKSERLWSRILLGALAILVLFPPFFEVFAQAELVSGFDKILLSENPVILVPFVSIEIALIYFYRVALVSLKSIDVQIVQIELRMAICRFIQSYAEYAKEIKSSDKDLLSRFEALIFSGIVSDSNNLPSTFDGLESIAKLVLSAKK